MRRTSASSCASFFLQGVIHVGEKRDQSKVTLVYGQMNEPPGARARVALTGVGGSACILVCTSCAC